MVDLEKLRTEAKKAISRDDVKYLIGWKQGTYGFSVTPFFARKPEDVENLIFSPLCVHNLATYLTLAEKLPVPRGQEPDSRKVALMVKGCDSRAVVQLMVEKGIPQENVVVLGCPCLGVIDPKKVETLLGLPLGQVSAEWKDDKIAFHLPEGVREFPKEEVLAAKCLTCRYPNPVFSNVMLGEEVPAWGKDEYDDVHELEAKKVSERWQYWQEKFSSCIRCYSCRNVCPLCYCKDCVLDRLNPTWVNRSNNIAENTAFQVARAFHLAGRCIECGECERVCPAGIPLMQLNRKLTKEVSERYSFEPGLDPEAKPLQASYCPDDQEDFIL